MWRVSVYYAFVFFTVGALLPFFALWLKSRSLDDMQVGIVVAAPSLVMVLTTVLVGSAADRARDWRSTIIICNWVIALLSPVLLLIDGFWPILVFWTIISVVFMGKMPVLDAASIRMARARGMEFHKMRAWGSLGFIGGTLTAGAATEFLGADGFVWLYVILGFLRALLGHTLPAFRGGIASDLSLIHI